MDALTKFMLNSIASILSNATNDPNVPDIHSMIDRIASRPVDTKDTNSVASVSPVSSRSQEIIGPKLKPFLSSDRRSCHDKYSNDNSSYTSSADEVEEQSEVDEQSNISSDDDSKNNKNISSNTTTSVSTSTNNVVEENSSKSWLIDGDMETDDNDSKNIKNISSNTNKSVSTSTNIVVKENGSKSRSIDGDMEKDVISPFGIPLEDIPFVEDSIANADIIQFPDGNKSYKLKGTSHQIGWALIQYGQTPTKKVSILYKRCLGVFECPVPDCKFRSRPRLPRNQRTKNAAPRPGKITHCKIHTSTELVHNSCDVLITVTRYPAENCV